MKLQNLPKAPWKFNAIFKVLSISFIFKSDEFATIKQLQSSLLFTNLTADNNET
jgi:hypothetical protein